MSSAKWMAVSNAGFSVAGGAPKGEALVDVCKSARSPLTAEACPRRGLTRLSQGAALGTDPDGNPIALQGRNPSLGPQGVPPFQGFRCAGDWLPRAAPRGLRVDRRWRWQNGYNTKNRTSPITGPGLKKGTLLVINQ